jgi:HK97 family phage prohead protease
MTATPLLHRSIQFKRASVTDTGTFSGYGAVFGNVDAYGDVIAAGAFTKSLATWGQRGKLPLMLLQHGGGFLGGAEDGIPIGQWTSMQQDGNGLKVEGQLFALDTQKGQYIYAGLKSGVLDGLSIGYQAVAYKIGTQAGEPERTLTEVDLFECSVVSFPANDLARVGSVKAAAETPRDLENLLRRIGFSAREAKRITAGGWSAYSKQPDRDDTARAVELLKQRTRALKR